MQTHICHLVYRLDYGGLENGLVNLINTLPADRYRHSIVCLAGYSDFRNRLREGVDVIDCPKRPGQDFGLYVRLWRLLRKLKPDVMHTRNLSTLEGQVPALIAGVPVRIHGEHGHDVHDLDNRKRRYRLMRQAFAPLVTQFVTVSRLLERYLLHDIGVARRKVERICNGVNATRFSPASDAARDVLAEAPFDAAGRLVIGTIGRMQPVKDQLTLARAFALLIEGRPELRTRLALVMVGDGPLRAEAEGILTGAGVADLAWLPGTRGDTPELLRSFDVFVLPSLAEGISNTILEAMASGLPVVATNVGGNPELVADGATGRLVPRDDPAALAAALESYVDDPARLHHHGAAARARVEAELSLARMVEQYDALYTRLTARLAR
jgi:sugar transferase (PEP-CTERM/EpsH1 system associated)